MILCVIVPSSWQASDAGTWTSTRKRACVGVRNAWTHACTRAHKSPCKRPSMHMHKCTHTCRPIVRQRDPDSDPRPKSAAAGAQPPPAAPPPRQLLWTDAPSQPGELPWGQDSRGPAWQPRKRAGTCADACACTQVYMRAKAPRALKAFANTQAHTHSERYMHTHMRAHTHTHSVPAYDVHLAACVHCCRDAGIRSEG